MTIYSRFGQGNDDKMLKSGNEEVRYVGENNAHYTYYRIGLSLNVMNRSFPHLPNPKPVNIETPFPTSPILSVPLGKSQEAIQGPTHSLPSKLSLPTNVSVAPEVNANSADRPRADVGMFKATVRYGIVAVLADVGVNPCEYISDGVTEFG